MTKQAFNIYRSCCHRRIRMVQCHLVQHTRYSEIVQSHSREARISQSVVIPPLERIAYILDLYGEIGIEFILMLGLPC